MRITRAAKVAAFPLTALILVALVACQGPIGPAGPSVTGPTGPSGPAGPSVTGPTGPTGPTGIGVLQLVNDNPVYLLVNDDARGRIGALPDPVDVSKYFRGGKSPVTYELVKTSDAADMFTAALADGILTVTLTDATLDGNYDPAADNDETGSYVTVKATDADKHGTDNGDETDDPNERKDIHILRNKAPTVPANADALTDIVGTHIGKDGMDATCKVFNICEFTIPNNAFADDLYDMQTGMPADHFTFTATTSSGRVSASVIGRKVTLTGIAPTYNDKTPPEDEPAIVTITAMDPGKLSVMRDLMVTVDGPPRIAERMASSYEVQLGTNNVQSDRTIIGNVGDYFDDPEDTDNSNATTAYQLKSSNPAFASVADGTVTSVAVTAKSVGTTTITVTATDGRGQTSTQSFTLHVKAGAGS